MLQLLTLAFLSLLPQDKLPELTIGKPVEGAITEDSPSVASRSLKQRFGNGAIRRKAYRLEERVPRPALLGGVARRR